MHHSSYVENEQKDSRRKRVKLEEENRNKLFRCKEEDFYPSWSYPVRHASLTQALKRWYLISPKISWTSSTKFYIWWLHNFITSCKDVRFVRYIHLKNIVSLYYFMTPRHHYKCAWAIVQITLYISYWVNVR